MLETAFTRLVGCRAPIMSAPMPDVATPDLVAAVADAGALGMLPTPLVPPDALAATLDALAARTRGAVGAGFLMPFLDRECVRVAARKARVVEFFYGEPDASLVREALTPPKPRHATKPTRASKVRRVEDKRKRAGVKKDRGARFGAE